LEKRIVMHDLYHFFKNVMIRLGYHGWVLNLIPNSSEGYCWRNRKRIDIGTNSKSIKSLLLHEIAHIDTCRFCNNKHFITFWRRYEDLMRRFLPSIVPMERYNEDVGFLSLVYAN